MQVKSGYFTKPATNNLRPGEPSITTLHSRSADGGQNVLNIGFPVKGIMFFTAYSTTFGVTEGNLRTTYANGVNVSIGMSDGTNHGTVGISSKDSGSGNTKTAQTITHAALVCISEYVEANSVVIMSLATCSFSGNDVTVQWHWNDGAEIIIGYIAFGGTDIQTKVLRWLSPGTDMQNPFFDEDSDDGGESQAFVPSLFDETSKLVTGVGFKSDMIFTIGSGLGDPDGPTEAPQLDGNASLFFSAAPRGQMSICQAVHDENNRFLAPQPRSISGLGMFDVLAHLYFYGVSATPTLETIVPLQAAPLGGADPAITFCRGTLSQINDDGFHVVYDSMAAGSAMPRFSLCIQGGRWKTMAITPPVASLPSSNRFQLHEELPFLPIGVMALHGHYGKALGAQFGSAQRYGTIGPNCLGVGVTDGADTYCQCHISAGPGPSSITAKVASKGDRLAILPGASMNPIPAGNELKIPTFTEETVDEETTYSMELEWTTQTNESQIVQLLLIGADPIE
jgi:hypothetical protein